MKKIITVCLLGVALTLTACATKQPGDADYGYEQATGSRTAGDGHEAAADAAKPTGAEKVFAKRQHK